MNKTKSHLPLFYRFMILLGKIAYVLSAIVLVYLVAVIVCDKVIFGYSVLMRWREFLIAFAYSVPWALVLRYVIKCRILNRDQLNLFFAFYIGVLIIAIVIMFKEYLDSGELENAFNSPIMLITMLLLSKYNQKMPNKGDDTFQVPKM